MYFHLTYILTCGGEVYQYELYAAFDLEKRQIGKKVRNVIVILKGIIQP